MIDIHISGYSAQPQAISLGTRGSVGIETLCIHTDATWDGLDRQAIFCAGTENAVGIAIPASGEVPVPAEATRIAGWNSLVLTGMAQGKIIYTCSVETYVQPQPADLADLSGPAGYTPDLISQYVSETRDDRIQAEAAAAGAQQSAETAVGAADEAQEAAGHYPAIINGTWWLWQGGPEGGYIDTGQPAQGPPGNVSALTNTDIEEIFKH